MKVGKILAGFCLCFSLVGVQNYALAAESMPNTPQKISQQIGRAHVRTPVTS